MPLPDTEKVPRRKMDDNIEMWRQNVQSGSPVPHIEVPLDLPVIALEMPSQVAPERQQNFFEFPDFGEFDGFSGVHNPDSQAMTSQSRRTTPTNGTWSASVHLRPLPERCSSILLADYLEQAGPEASQAQETLPEVFQEQVEDSQTLCPTVNISNRDLGETTLRDTPTPDVASDGDSQDNTSAQRPSLRLAIPSSEVKEFKLLNGRPFSLNSLDSTSTRTSIRDPGDGDLSTAMPRQVKSKKPRVSASENSVTASAAFTHRTEITIPIFPYAHMTTVCRERHCPIVGRHEKGPYLHGGKLRTREGSIFGASNPPPNVWEAFDRLRHGTSTTPNDVKLVDNFKKFHFGFAQQGNVEMLGSPVKSQAGSTKPPKNRGFLGTLRRFGAFKRR